MQGCTCARCDVALGLLCRDLLSSDYQVQYARVDEPQLAVLAAVSPEIAETAQIEQG